MHDLCMAWIAVLLMEFSGNCTTGDVQLVGGRNPREGRVEVCVQGHWVVACHDRWTYREAEVVCRQLNYVQSESSNSIDTYRMRNKESR